MRLNPVSEMPEDKPREHHSGNTEGDFAQFQPAEKDSGAYCEHDDDNGLCDIRIFCR